MNRDPEFIADFGLRMRRVQLTPTPGEEDAVTAGWQVDRCIAQEVKDRNRDLLLTMWRVAVQDPAACMVRFHVSDSTARFLAGLTLRQVLRAGSAEDLLFEPRFDARRLELLAGDEAQGDEDLPRGVSPMLAAMSYASLSPRS